MRRWVLYVDAILLITALLILVIDFQTKQDILRATKEFYDAKRQAEGYTGRDNPTGDIPSGLLSPVSDDNESVGNEAIVEESGTTRPLDWQEVVYDTGTEPFTRSPNQAIPGINKPVGA